MTILSSDITVVIPTIPPRETLLARAEASVHSQTLKPARTITVVDHAKEGAAVTRQRGLDLVDTEWVAFLDDDDELLPHHLDTLAAAVEYDPLIDLTYPWFHIRGPKGESLTYRDPLKIDGRPAYGHAFDDVAKDWLLHHGNFIPVTVLVRTDAIMDAGGFPEPNSPQWPHPDCEDWGCWQSMARRGFNFHHVPRRTWIWHWNGKNTSGRPDRW